MVDEFAAEEPDTSPMCGVVPRTPPEGYDRRAPRLRVVIAAEVGELETLTEMLQLDGHRVQRAARSEEVLDFTRRWTPDAVVVHVRSNDSPSRELAARLRSTGVPVIVTLGERVGEIVVDAFAVFREPFDLDDLRMALLNVRYAH
jgi:DNA-binding response OmpR family regulator